MVKQKQKSLTNMIVSIYIILLLILSVFFPMMYQLTGFTDTVKADSFDTRNLRKTITIDHTKIQTPLVNFPLLITIDDATADKCDGGKSLLFRNSDDTVTFYHEIEKWVDGSDRIVWVNVTRISNTSDTKFYMYYNDSTAVDNQSPADVWDDNYVAVWHMNDSTSTTIKDMTGRNNTVTKIPGYLSSEITGKIGYGQLFDDTDYSNCTNSLDYIFQQDVTIEAWVKPNATSGYNTIFSHLPPTTLSPSGYAFALDDDTIRVRIFGDNQLGGGEAYIISSPVISANNWSYVTMTANFNQSSNFNASLYFNGTLNKKSNMSFPANLTWGGMAQMGAYYYGTPTYYGTFNGYMDEIRLSKIRRNTSWVNASFLSQTNQLISIGSEEYEWYDTMFTYRKLITIDKNYVDNNLVGFPVLVHIASDTGLADHSLKNGSDIIFTSYENTIKYSHEIEHFNPDTGELWAWVKINLSSTSDTKFWLYYKNEDAVDTQNPDDVWSDYSFVSHMNDLTSSTIEDVSGNNIDGTKQYSNKPVETDGKIYKSQDFERADTTWISTSDNDALSIGNGTSDVPATISMWIKIESQGTYNMLLGKLNTDEYVFYFYTGVDPSASGYWFSCYDPGTGAIHTRADQTNSFAYDTGVWHYMTIAYKGNSIANGSSIYHNATNITTKYETGGGVYVAMDNGGAGLEIGDWAYGHSSTYNYDGLMDEVRIKKGTEDNTSWIKADYHNQNCTTGWMTIGDTEKQSGESNPPINSNPYPADDAIDVERLPKLAITVNSQDANQMNVTFKTNATGSWGTIGTNSSVSNGTYRWTNNSMTRYSTKYWWRVCTNDGMGGWDNNTYSFTTEPINTTVDAITPYGIYTSPLTITATGISSLDNVTLYYKYSTDNLSFNPSNQGASVELANVSIDSPEISLNYPNWAVVKENDTAVLMYVASQNDNTLQVVDVTDPANPIGLDALAGFGSIHDVRVIDYDDYGRVAFTASYIGDTVDSVNVTDSNNIAVMDSIGGAGSPNYLDSAFYLDVDETNKILYVTGYDDDSIVAIDISDPNDLTLLSELHGASAHLDAPWWVYVNKNNSDYIYVVDYSTPPKIVIYDVSNPSSITYVKNISCESIAWLNQDGDYMYSTNSTDASLVKWDISDPDDWNLTSETNVGGVANNMNIFYNYAFMRESATDQGFKIVDLSTGQTYLTQTGDGGLGGYHWMDVQYNSFKQKYVFYAVTYNPSGMIIYNLTFNESKGGWIKWASISNPDTSYPWSWDFNFTNDTGYYEFASKGKWSGIADEILPDYGDAICEYLIAIPVVLTNASTGVEETNATLHGFLNFTAITTTCGFWYDTDSGIPYTNNQTVGTVANHTAFSYNAGSLQPGTRYYFRAWAKASSGFVNGSEFVFFTKPNEPTGLTVANTDEGEQTISWIHGTGYNKSVVRGQIGSYPADPQSGIAIYNNSGNSVIRTSLTVGTVWYYRVWEYTEWDTEHKFSDTYAQGYNTVSNSSIVTTNTTTSVEETTATLNGYLLDNGSSDATCGFWYDTDSGEPYANNQTVGVIGNHAPISYSATSLQQGTRYYVRAWSKNSVGFTYGSETSFITKPDAPTGLIISNTGSGQQTLSWTHGLGYDKSVVRGNIGSYPADPQSGTDVHNNTNNTVVRNGLTAGNIWYYRVWEYIDDGGETKFSDTYAQGYLEVAQNITVITNPATVIEETSATLSGNFTETETTGVTSVGFDYGTTTGYGSSWTTPYTPSGYDNYIYVGGATMLKVYKYSKTSLAKIAESPSLGATVRNIVTDNTYAYVVTLRYYTDTFKLWKSNLSSQTSTQYDYNYAVCVAQDDNYIYVGGYMGGTPPYASSAVVKFSKATLAKVGQTPAYGSAIRCIAVDNNYIYVGGEGGKVFEYNKNTLVKERESLTYGGIIYAISAEDSTYVYAGGATTNKVIKYYKSSLNKASETTSYGGTIWTISEDSSYLYVGGETTYKVYKYLKTTLAKVGETATYGGNIYATAEDDTHLYVGGATTQKVYKYLKSDLSKVGETPNYGGIIYAIATSESTFPQYITFTQNLAVFNPGTLYHFRAKAINPDTVGYGLDSTFLTKPNEPTNLVVTNTNPNEQTITWSHGTGYNKSVVRGNIGSYPATPQSGTDLYNGTNTTLVRTNLTTGNVWYYRIWEYTEWGTEHKFSDTYTQANKAVAQEVLVNTNSATGILNRNATMSGTVVNNGSEDIISIGFEYGLNTSYGNIYTNSTFTLPTFAKSITDLSPGRLYHYRAKATNIFITGYGSDKTFLTKPDDPTGLTITNIDDTHKLDWTHGEGYNRSVIRGSYTTYPSTPQSGDSIYNDTGNSYTYTPSTPGKLYRYRAWEFTLWNTTTKFSNSYAQGYALSRPNPPVYFNYYLQGSNTVNVSWVKGTGANKTVVVMKNTGMPTSRTDGTLVYNGTKSYMLYDVEFGKTYYFKSWSYTEWTSPSISQYSTNSTPFEMSGLMINCYDETTHENITFNVKITNQAGTEVYENNGCTNTHLINTTTCPNGNNIQIYITATGYQPRTYVHNIYTDVFVLFNAYLPKTSTPGGTPPDGDTTDCDLRTYIDSKTVTSYIADCVIPFTYTLEGMISVEIYNRTLYGTYGGWIFVAGNKYTFTTSQLTIDKSALDKNTTMARVNYYYYYCPSESASALYSIHIVETVVTDVSQYDMGVENAYVIIKRYVNTTGTYLEVSSLYTDANGYITVYLLPNTPYKVFINKTDYDSVISDFIPTPPNQYGQTLEKTLRIKRTLQPGGGTDIPDITDIFDNITYSFNPTATRHSQSYTFYYNISSIDGQLQWYRMNVWYYNDALSTWVLLDSQNETDIYGGSINYTLPNVSGKYEFQCYFKKIGYTEYEFGETGSLIQFIVFLKQGLKYVPDFVWFLITIILMIVGMGFFIRYFGAGIATGYIGLGIFAIMLLFKDFSVPLGGVGGTISGWMIWGITFLMYTVGVFLYSRL